MAKQVINVGTAANDKKGDSLRAAFQKVNTNFTELYTALGINADVDLNLGAFEFTGSTISTTDSSAIVIDQATTITSNLSVGGDLLPQTALGGDLGSSTLPWRSLYVSQSTIYLGGVPLTLDANNNLTVNGSRVGTTSYADLSDKPTSFSSLVNGSKTVSLGSNGTLTLPSQPNLLTNVNQIFTTKIYKDAKTPTPTPAEITTAYDYWLGEQEFYNAIRNEDASSIAPATRSWAGLPPWEAYPLIVGFTGPGLPPPNSLATAAQSAINAYLSWKELVSNLEIVNGNQTISFENTGNLILPSTVSMNGKLSLGPTLGGIHANQSTGIISIGDYIDADTGYGLAPSTTIAIGGAANVFQISTYGPPAKTWTFGKDGNLQIPGNLQISGDIRSEREINIDINLSDSTLRRWQFGEDGSLTLPSVGKINNGAYDWTFGSTGNTTFPTGLTLAAARGPNTVNFTSGIDKEFQIETQTNTTGRLWNFSTDGSLTIPGDIKSNSNINIDINLSDSTLRRWQFGEDGYLTLPNDRGINSSTNIKIELPNSIPSGITNLTSNGGWNQGSYTNLATTGGTGTGLTVNAASQASNGYLDTIAINTAGSGYTNGDVITITNENFLTATFTVTVPAANTWTFGENGRTTFPNGAVPVHSYGVAGDKEGMVAFDDTYIYYCTADYVNNISDIWKRVAWSGSTW